MKIAEIFYSIQGEGARAGDPSIFIRLSGCDLTCGFCDTEFESGKDFTCEELFAYIYDRWPQCNWIVWTGGEPMLTLTRNDILFFKTAGYLQACESNGNHPIPETIDWRVVSPKVAEHVLKKKNPNGVDELRYVRHSGQPGIPVPAITAKRYFLSPMFKGNQPDPASIKVCLDLCLANPSWSLSVQTHKVLNVL
jgi:7-carboxy-7-deazaguanine synthase